MVVLPVESPSGDIALAARTLLHDACPRHVVDHCERSYQFAGLIARAEGVAVDDEVLYVGTLLHDIALSDRFSGPERFEPRGANVARRFALDQSMSQSRAEAVWDIVALHASTSLARNKSREVAIANRGISFDIRGVGVELPRADVLAVLSALPREGFPQSFHRTLVDEVRTNVGSVRGSWMESIAVREVPGYVASDFTSGLLGSVAFCAAEMDADGTDRPRPERRS